MMRELTFNDLPAEVGRLSNRISELFDLLKTGNRNVAVAKDDGPMLIDEACSYLRISKPTLYRYCNQRKIISYKHPDTGRLYFLKEDLLTFLNSGRRRTMEEIKSAAITDLKR